MARERLSSRWTFFYQVILPVVWIAGFGGGTLLLWFGDFQHQDNLPLPEMKYAFLLAWVSGTPFLLWFSKQVHHVWIEGDHLEIKHLTSAHRVPTDLMLKVTETRFWTPKMIKIDFRSRQATLSSIRFIAPVVVQVPFGDHPVVSRLNLLLNGKGRGA
jgi:hypothetical protein